MKMKMKIMMALLVAFTLMFAVMHFVLAEEDVALNLSEDNTAVLDEATIADLNDSAAEELSATNVGWKKFLLMFTFNKDKKIDGEMSLAKIYLAKANMALKNGDIEAFQAATAQYENTLSDVVKKVDSPNKGAGNEDLLIDAATRLAGIQGQINVHEQKLENLLNMLADSNLTDEEIAQVNVSITKIQNIISELNQVKTERENEIKIKLMAAGNLTEAEVDALIEDIEAKNLTAIYAVSAQLRIMHAETILQKFTAFVNQGAEAGKNVSELQAKLNLSAETIQQSWALYNAGDYKAAIQLIEPISSYERQMNPLINKEAKEKDSYKKELILKEMSAEKKEILQNQIEKKKEIIESQWEKKQEILENQIDKKKEISAEQNEKKKEILQAQMEKKKEILQNQIDKKKIIK